MDETLERAREHFAPAELPAALSCLHELGRLAHYWPTIERLLERKSAPPAAALEAVFSALAARACAGQSCCAQTPTLPELPEFIVFYSHALNDAEDAPQRPVAATCCVCAQLRAKGSDDWYPRALIQPLLPEDMLFSHGMCFDCARVYELELAI